jgi:hypothetical protein
MGGCATENAPLFQEPEKFAGQVTTACGYLEFEFENLNFYRSKGAAKRDTDGVGVIPGNVNFELLEKMHEQYVCLEGTVEYIGCGVDAICSASNFQYRMIVDRIVDP